jgi:hypothetical protein
MLAFLQKKSSLKGTLAPGIRFYIRDYKIRSALSVKMLKVVAIIFIL